MSITELIGSFALMGGLFFATAISLENVNQKMDAKSHERVQAEYASISAKSDIHKQIINDFKLCLKGAETVRRHHFNECKNRMHQHQNDRAFKSTTELANGLKGVLRPEEMTNDYKQLVIKNVTNEVENTLVSAWLGH